MVMPRSTNWSRKKKQQGDQVPSLKQPAMPKPVNDPAPGTPMPSPMQEEDQRKRREEMARKRALQKLSY